MTDRPKGPRGGKRTPIGLRIDARLDQIGRQQKQLAVALHVSVQFLSALLSGDKAFSAPMRQKAAGPPRI